jgi:hypothetical protein
MLDPETAKVMVVAGVAVVNTTVVHVFPSGLA